MLETFKSFWGEYLGHLKSAIAFDDVQSSDISSYFISDESYLPDAVKEMKLRSYSITQSSQLLRG